MLSRACPIGRFGQRVIGAGGQEHREIVVITEFLPEVADSFGHRLDRRWPVAAEQP